jgi:hypothetical protein
LTIAEKPSVDETIDRAAEWLGIPCRCIIEGCRCPMGGATATQVKLRPDLCDQKATQEDGLCDTCREHIRRGHVPR